MTAVFGIGPVLELLRAGRRGARRIWVAEGRGREGRIEEILAEAARQSIEVRPASRDELARRTGSSGHQGILAEAEELPRVSWEQALAAGPGRPALLVVLDGVQDPQNLGAILRAAECAGAQAVIVPRDRAAALTPAAVKVAEGAAEHVPVVVVTNLSRTLRDLQEAGIWTIGLAGDAIRGWDEVDWKGPSAVVLGGEGQGLRRLVRESCDDCAGIPLFGHLDSLNVAAAAAAVLFEAVRQRIRAGGASSGQRLARGPRQ